MRLRYGVSLNVKRKRITANLPVDLLEDAMAATRKSVTDTLIEGLQLVVKATAYYKAEALRGRLHLDIDIDESRERKASRKLNRWRKK